MKGTGGGVPSPLLSLSLPWRYRLCGRTARIGMGQQGCVRGRGLRRVDRPSRTYVVFVKHHADRVLHRADIDGPALLDLGHPASGTVPDHCSRTMLWVDPRASLVSFISASDRVSLALAPPCSLSLRQALSSSSTSLALSVHLSLRLSLSLPFRACQKKDLKLGLQWHAFRKSVPLKTVKIHY